MNPGDRKALFYLVSYFKPLHVLEIGTHIGVSTLHIASAMAHYRARDPKNIGMVSLDFRDVNSSYEKPWLKYGTKYTPARMVYMLHYDDFLTFKTMRSLDFFSRTTQKFDFIFLDGNHSASAVYREIPSALEVLEDDGVILLHDYFPDNEPIWDNGKKISGPYLAVERLIKEGANLGVLPLGKLPWKTKGDSRLTSLALLFHKN
ncbi:MAG: class I SAM-dependent methyltransferase [Balneolaceae bacterium]|nr:class I SAM-dependent methyltransferase [Balneolaceae bacterium]